ncbi:unnamed protein product [Gemmataceae bacterium]|nr:unnamed protein product [Gemmataceae bacterium]VTT99472.1 unnamed protein product [Gemmataceae bacterium]
MHAPLFGLLEGAENALTELVHSLLLIAGGLLVGYVAGGVLAWAVGRYAFKQKDTYNFKAVGKPVGGAIVAVIVAALVLTGKGKPIGDGGDGKGTANTDPNSKSGPPVTPPDGKADPKAPPKIDIKPADVTLRVTVLGGEDVVNERFYQLDDDRTPKTFGDLKAAITERRKGEKGKVVVAILFPARNALPREHPAVTQVAKWAAEDAGLDVVFPAVK